MDNTNFIILMLICMIFLHIVDDYYLQQGVLANMKQKSWWEKNYSSKKYKYDYIVALIVHGFSWTFMIMLPAMIKGFFPVWLFVINWIIHSVTDHLKANMKKINLITDQMIHLLQIYFTWVICFVI